MLVALYARKSTESEDRQVQSLEDQIKAMKEVAIREGFRIAETYQESKSAKVAGKRPEFDRLMKAVERRQIGGILCWSVDRLARNMSEGGQVIDLLSAGTLPFIRSVSRYYRPEDNPLILAVEMGMAAGEIKILRERVTRGMRGKAERGWHVSKAPLGYLNDPDSREIVPDPERFPLVRQAWDLVLAGISVAEVHRRFSALGLNCSSRKRTRPPISYLAFYKLFQNPFYIGMLPYKGEMLQGKHAPMVTESEFYRVKSLIQRNCETAKPKSRTFAFGGAFKCAKCGCMVIGDRREKHYRTSGRTAVYIYYHCTGSKGCSKKAIREEELTDLVAGMFVGMDLKPTTAGWLKEAFQQLVEKEATGTATKVASFQREREREEARLKGLTMMRANNELGEEEFADHRAFILERMATIRESSQRTLDDGSERIRFTTMGIDVAAELIGLCRRGFDPSSFGRTLGAAGGGLLNLETVQFSLHPVIEKIATFERLRDGSETPERGDLLPLTSEWWTLVKNLLTCVPGSEAENRCIKRLDEHGEPLPTRYVSRGLRRVKGTVPS